MWVNCTVHQSKDDIDATKMLIRHLFLFSSLSFCLAQEGEKERSLPDLDDNTFVGKIQSFMKELKECQAINKELVKEFSNIRADIEDIKKMRKRNDEKISEVQSSVTQLSEDLTDHKKDISVEELVTSLAESISSNSDHIKQLEKNLHEKVESLTQSVLDFNTTVDMNSAKITDLSEDKFTITSSNQKRKYLIENNTKKKVNGEIWMVNMNTIF